MDDKKERRFRTLDEIEEEYNAQEHNFQDELKDVGKNLKEQLFSPWGLMIMAMLAVSILGAIVQ